MLKNKWTVFLIHLITLGKHIMKNPFMPLLLICIPVFSLILQNVPAFSDDSALNIGIYFEHDDDFSEALKNSLLARDDSFQFILFTDSDEMTRQVQLEQLECAYIFKEKPDIFSNRYRDTITLLVSPSTMFDSAVNEILYSAVLRIGGADLITNYVDSAGISISGSDEAKEYLLASYEAYCEGSETFHLDIESVSGISLNEEGNASLGIRFPLRGLLSILIFLAALLGAVLWLTDSEKGIFAPRSFYFQITSQLIYIAVPALSFILCSELALALTGNTAAPLKELFIAFRYLCIIMVFCLLCIHLLKKSSLLVSFIPVLALGSLIFCPIFVNIESIIPMLSFFSRLFIPRYFLIG